MKRVALGAALLLIGVAVLLAGAQTQDGNWPTRALSITFGGVLTATAALILSSATSRRAQSDALFRADHFLPFLRKKKQKETLGLESLPVRAARKLLPSLLFADRVTGKPGLLRRSLKRLGPTVLAAPLRRVVQAACFGLFLWLFFCTLWPYSAQPAAPGKVATGWQFQNLDGEAGDLTFARSGSGDWRPAVGERIFLVDARALDAVRGDFGQFEVVAVDDDTASIAATAALADEQINALFTSSGTWDFHERAPWPCHYTDELANKEFIPAETFLAIDPLLSLSTAIASRSWVWSLASAGIILLVCVLIPRGFCGYLCPLGTLIDLFDWAISRRTTRFNVAGDGWWVHIKYYLLAGTLVCAVFGVLVSG
ncbi:MAG: 4Fe-4S binding protein, partial [Planctomycetales bacterium]|nr:4Fe-4S binding protein [Planctomycetales bacterium]